MNCPCCNDPLSAATYMQVPIYMCKLCEGIWVTPQNLDLLKKTQRRFDDKEVVKVKLLREWKVVEGERPSLYCCPTCAQRLVQTHYKDIPSLILNRCSKGCGVWINKDDLEKIHILEDDGG